MRLIKTALVLIMVMQSYFFSAAHAQGKFTAADYKRALWMTTRFYGAQKCGNGPNWLLMEHPTPEYRTSFTHDADASANNYDLEGGWFDCGDHVTFGQTFFFSAYLLAKAYSMFPCGFPDLYNGKSYLDYLESGNWDIDGGKADGIPDLLEELKYAADWMIKATPDASTFYYQKGEGAKDHLFWVTAGRMSAMSVDSGGEPRKIFKNPNDGVMASYAAATLSVMSRIYKRFDSSYAQHCLEHARNAYAYAKPKKNNAAGAGDGSYYGAHSNPPVVAFIVAASEMFKTTGEASFKTDAQADQNQIVFHNWGLDYSNSHDLAPFALGSCLGDTAKLSQTKTMFIDQYTNNLNSEGISTRGNSGWGALRYPANAACLAAFWAQAKKTATLDTFIFKQVDYILGANNAKQSFIVGFCSGCTRQPLHPHHRNVYLRDDNPNDSAKALMEIPDRNTFFGYMVGGTWNSSSYTDKITDYSTSEGGLDYNAGLVGALGYIVNRLDPVDTGNFIGIFHEKQVNRSRTGRITVRRIGASLLFGAADQDRIANLSVYNQSGMRLFFENPAASLARWTPTCAPGVVYVHVRLENGKNAVFSCCVMR
jgi:endoglucanase